MAYTSQFTIYSAGDTGGPGYLNGLTGSLINVLNACLVNGYGSKPGAGWTKPLPDSASVYGCYQQPTGSKFTLYVNDNVQTGTEGYVVGWESLTTLVTGSANSNQGSGLNPYPLPSQGINGCVVWRKSATSGTATNRYWILAADSSSMYLWVQAGDIAGTYNFYAFGDCYSLVGTNDRWKSYIIGRIGQGYAGYGNSDWTDQLPYVQGPGGFPNVNYQGTAQPGHFIARSAFGSGTSLNFTKRGDSGVSAAAANTSTGPTGVTISGVLSCPNGPDGAFYMCPLHIAEPGVVLRGRMRGLYQVGHPIGNFSDGQLIQGSGDFAGKTFMIVRPSLANSFWALEVSNTVETN